MGKTLILDGYNVIYKLPSLEASMEQSLNSARNALAVYMAKWKINNDPTAKICIVFDGRDGIAPDGSNTGLHGINCVFTHTNEDADDRISLLLKNARDTKNIYVISADNKVANSCRVYGARIKHPEFLEEKKTKKQRAKLIEPKKTMDQATIDKINKELKGIWGLD